MTKIVLDAESFKALASDTRLQILKSLDARPLTVSELSRLLGLNKATVFEHLKQLMAAELTKRDEDPARKWVYYRLTWKGRNVLHPENAQIFLMLSLSGLGFGGAVLQLGRIFDWWLASKPQTEPETTVASGPMQTAALNRDAASDSQPSSGAAGATAPTSSAPAPTPGQGAAGGGEEGHWYDFFTNTDFLLIALTVVLVALIGLTIWALLRDQREERAAWRLRIEALPPDVNEGESHA